MKEFWKKLGHVLLENAKLFFGILKQGAIIGLEAITKYLRFIARCSIVYLISFVLGILLVWIFSIYGQHGLRVLSFLGLIGVPTAVMVTLLWPVIFCYEEIRSRFPELHKKLSRTVNYTFITLFYAFSFAIILAVMPIENNVPAFGLLSLVTLALILGSATGHLDFDAVKFFRTRLKWYFLIVSCGCLLAIWMPDLFHQVRTLPSLGNNYFADKPIPEQFNSSDQIEFVDLKGNTKLYYVQRAGGGFDLFYANASGYFDKSGMELKPADSKKIRQEITAWVDQQASLKVALAQEQARQQQQTETELQKKQELEVANLAAKNSELAQKQAEETHRETLNRYLNHPSAGKSVGQINLAVVVQGMDKGIDSAMSDALAKQLNKNSIGCDGSAFKTAFATDGLLDSLFSGDTTRFSELELTNRADYVLVAEQNAEYTTNAQMDGIISSQLTFRARLISTTTGESIDKFEVSASGADFTKERADIAAQGSLTKQLNYGRLDEIQKEILAQAK